MPIATRDTWLASFLDLAYRAEFSAGLTVTTGGLVISGKPISSSEFMRLQGERFIEAWRQATDGAGTGDWERYFTDTVEAAAAGAQQAREKMSQAAEDARRMGQELSDEAQQRIAEELLPQFICMKDVTIFGAQPQPISIPLWRGRLTEISGWTFGELQ